MDVLEEEVETFLEHFGVKGMHWGIRNKSVGEPTTPRQARAKAARRGALKKGLIAGGIAAVVSAGAAYALWKMRGFGKTPVSKLPVTSDITSRAVKRIQAVHGPKSVFDLKNRKIIPTTSRNSQGMRFGNPRLNQKVSDIMERRKETQSAYQTYLKKRNIQPTTLPGVRKALKNPKHIWEL